MKKPNGINHWPEEERPRERLLKYGPDVLSPAEFLAIFLRTGTRGESAVDFGRRLLDRFGGIQGLYSANDKDLLAVKGMGPSKLATVRAVIGFTRLYILEKAQVSPCLTKPDEVFKLIKCSIQDHTREGYWILLLDNQGKVLGVVSMPNGTLNECSLHPREIGKEIYKYGAAKLVLAHNHPAGDPTPGEKDKAATHKVAQLCSALEVEFLDHIVIGRDKYFSYRNSGMLR